jgi:hypothetical protein
MKKLLSSSLILSLIILFAGWGYNGHKIINNRTVFFFPSEMSSFQAWQSELELHASDADNRKGSDPTEAPKHYIDIDNYPEFINTGSISQNFDSLVAIHGLSFVMDQGILPWAVIASYDSLKSCFGRRDWNKAILFAADLGHYVGDSHMPLHLTRNYNGQFTGQTGIHSRYESTMINRYYNQIVFQYDTAVFVENVSDFVFEMVYVNYPYVDLLLAAELTAKTIAGNTTSDLYYQKLWDFTKDFTTRLFALSSEKLASLIYTAWVNAGSPSLITGTEEEQLQQLGFSLDQNYPNPFNPSTTISYKVTSPGFVNISIYSIDGELKKEAVSSFHNPGSYQFTFDGSELPSGVYFYKAQTGDHTAVKKMILLK